MQVRVHLPSPPTDRPRRSHPCPTIHPTPAILVEREIRHVGFPYRIAEPAIIRLDESRVFGLTVAVYARRDAGPAKYRCGRMGEGAGYRVWVRTLGIERHGDGHRHRHRGVDVDGHGNQLLSLLALTLVTMSTMRMTSFRGELTIWDRRCDRRFMAPASMRRRLCPRLAAAVRMSGTCKVGRKARAVQERRTRRTLTRDGCCCGVGDTDGRR